MLNSGEYKIFRFFLPATEYVDYLFIRITISYTSIYSRTSFYKIIGKSATHNIVFF